LNKSQTNLKEPQNRLVATYMAQLQRERYSRQTVRNYTNHFIRFLQHCNDRQPSDLSAEEVTTYIQNECDARSLSVSTVNVLSYSIRYYYERVLNSPKHVMRLTYKKVEK
jgi:site-specific recombinase XerD